MVDNKKVSSQLTPCIKQIVDNNDDDWLDIDDDDMNEDSSHNEQAQKATPVSKNIQIER